MSAHTNGVPTLSQLAESGLITTWQTRPPPCTKGRCHFINLLWPHQRVNSPSKKKKEKEKSCHYRRHIIRVSVCLFSCHLLLPPFVKRLSTVGGDRRCISRRRSEAQIREKVEWKHNQRWWFHWLFIIRWGWSLAGSLLDYPSWGDCQVLTPPRFHPPPHRAPPPPRTDSDLRQSAFQLHLISLSLSL